jgi:GNAT superfamily N-acetyltransferase
MHVLEIELRTAVDKDWKVAWPIKRNALDELVRQTYGGWTESAEEEAARNWDPAAVRMIIFQGDAVGWVQVNKYSTHDWLELLVVDPSVQGHGLGTQVLSVLLDEASQRDVPLWLSVYRSNRARHLYARLCFAERPRDEIRMLMVHPASAVNQPPVNI